MFPEFHFSEKDCRVSFFQKTLTKEHVKHFQFSFMCCGINILVFAVVLGEEELGKNNLSVIFL